MIFGGQFDGDIVLLHSMQSIFSMPLPCPAHDSRVTKLVGASNVLTNTYTSEGSLIVQSGLISYGKISDRLHIWAIQINEAQFTVSLHLLLVVRMTARPRFISFIHSTVCMALEDNQIVMFRTQSDDRTSFSVQVENIASVQLLEHQEEDEHTNNVTSLTACPCLKIFVSSSKDGTIKVWNTENQLMSDINFGVPLSSVGFANAKGDLLVGLQLQISIIHAVDYLPKQYWDISNNSTQWDYKERPISFDPHLEFWWVPPNTITIITQHAK